MKMSITPKLIHTFNKIQISTELFLELDRVIHVENLTWEDSQENSEDKEQWGGLAIMQPDIEMYYYKVTANEMKSYEQRNRQTNGTEQNLETEVQGIKYMM